MELKAVLIRLSQLSNHKQTCGRFILLDDDGNLVFQCSSLELPWNGNIKNISCIPAGNYSITKISSPKFGKNTFAVSNVPGRSHILIHPGNFTSDIEGCILLGERFGNLDNNDITDVVNSKATINKIKSLADSFELTIIQI